MGKEEEQATKKHSGAIIATIIIVLIVAAVMTWGLIKSFDVSDKTTQNGSSSGSMNSSSTTVTLFKRDARNSDINLYCDLDMNSFGAKFTITPQVDIEELELEIRFLDKNEQLIKTITKYVGNVKEGVQVSFSISISEIGLINALKIEYGRASVSGGKVSYFA